MKVSQIGIYKLCILVPEACVYLSKSDDPYEILYTLLQHFISVLTVPKIGPFTLCMLGNISNFIVISHFSIHSRDFPRPNWEWNIRPFPIKK